MRSTDTSNVIRLYDSTAWYWDSWVHRGVYQKAYCRLFKALQSEGLIEKPDSLLRVLDCGVGTGLLTEALARTIKAPLDLHGIDTSPGMLNRARRHMGRAGIRTSLEQADIRALPFEESEMDLVMGALVLDHIAEPVVALREMARVTVPRGTVLIVATRSHAPDLPFRVAFHYKPFPENLVTKWMADSGIQAVCVRELSGIARLFAQAYVGTNGDKE